MTAPLLQRQPWPVLRLWSASDGSAIRQRLAALSAHLLIALLVLVGIGGATRVMEAGLACPDWPLCYGTLLPGRQMNLQVFLEWFHRLDAFVVGIGLLVQAAASFWWRRQLPGWQPPLALACVVLVAVQGGLGALTVLQLLPSAVVTAHLITALVLVALLSGSHQGLRQGTPGRVWLAPSPAEAPVGLVELRPHRWLFALTAIALAVLLAQCCLGGLMATQWAAGRCLRDGDACSWLLLHRLGARCAGLTVLAVAAWLSWRRSAERPLALLASALVVLQIALGIFSLRLTLAVPMVTVAHQVTAALLVAVLSALLVRLGSAFSVRPALGSHG